MCRELTMVDVCSQQQGEVSVGSAHLCGEKEAARACAGERDRTCSTKCGFLLLRAAGCARRVHEVFRV